MAKRVVLLSIVAVVVLALAGAEIALAKAHVPLGRVQVCTADGQVKNIASRLLGRRLDAGGCRLTACVFDDVAGDDVIQQFIFVPGDNCNPTDANGDNFCDATGAPKDIPRRLKAVNVTPACTSSF